MSDIRHWAAGALAVVTLAVGTGAGVVLASAETPLSPPVAAVAAPAPAPEGVAPPVTPTPAAGPAEAPVTTAPTTTTGRTTTTTTTRRRTAAECTRIADASSLSTARLRSYLRSIGCSAALETTRSRSTREAENLLNGGRTRQEAYAACVASPASPGPTACRGLTRVGG